MLKRKGSLGKSKHSPIVIYEDDDSDTDVDTDVDHPSPVLVTLPKRVKHVNDDGGDDDGGEEDRPSPKRVKKSESVIHYVPPEDAKHPDISSFTIDVTHSCAHPKEKKKTKGFHLTEKNACSFFSTPLTGTRRNKLWDALMDRVEERIDHNLYRQSDHKTVIDARDMAFVFEAFDSVYFNGSLWKIICTEEATLEFRISRSHHNLHPHFTDNTAGYCFRQTEKIYTLEILLSLFESLFKSTRRKFYVTFDVPCTTRLECFLHVFAHELCHLVLQRFCYEKVCNDQHGELFMKMAKNLFGQGTYTHKLMPNLVHYY